MQIALDLSRHCIETEIKRRRNRCISRYFREVGARPAIKGELELLEAALATLDFGALRIRYPALNGHSDAAVTLAREENGRLVIRVDGATVEILAVPRRKSP
jgi:hypothetical protein